MSKTVRLTDAQRRLLIQLVNVVEANEWTAGDYNFSLAQFQTLQRAKAELETPSGARVKHVQVVRERDYACHECGNWTANKGDLCSVCQDIADHRAKGRG